MSLVGMNTYRRIGDPKQYIFFQTFLVNYLSYSSAEAYGISDKVAAEMKDHVNTLQTEFMMLTRLVKNDAAAVEYIKSLHTVERVRKWFELNQPSAKRLCSAAKRSGESVKKAAKKA